jgi:hypothetical protein
VQLTLVRLKIARSPISSAWRWTLLKGEFIRGLAAGNRAPHGNRTRTSNVFHQKDSKIEDSRHFTIIEQRHPAFQLHGSVDRLEQGEQVNAALAQIGFVAVSHAVCDDSNFTLVVAHQGAIEVVIARKFAKAQRIKDWLQSLKRP